MNIYRLSFVSCLVMAMPCAMAVEFNLNVLDKSMRDRIDISLLKEKGVIAPGEYFVSVAVNNNKISNGQKINWQKKGDKTIPCINDSLVDKFGLKPDIRQSLPQIDRCIDFSSRPEMLFNFDQANQQLNIREGANKRGNSSRLTQSFHFFMFEPIFSPVNALNQPI
ncbi:outer membrane protein [Escherichia coli]|nr:outer membrane protein [Escherichia coli]